DRGDIYHVDLDPPKGKEQQGARYVLIVSPREFNRGGTSLVCPITQGGNYARNKGFAVSLCGAGTNVHGLILSNQLRILDIAALGGRFCEKVPEHVVDEVIAKLQTLLD
ncbi:MAG: type II toxin-antitoxin system PemK/MazF family toxin, partial [Beijerinckiaceae bacterium]|nr:type II toxin-antitoxin system PemK/MazF family toxin [Beijerinckiaceae bacterium]